MRRSLIILVCAGALAAMPAAAAAQVPTPELIERAERVGRIEHSRAQLLCACALGGSGTAARGV
ncbi:MAG TPA: hypothetical protein VEY90_02785, partial [Thermoleophilaceae bacterium]|nr:hypothetical protein [Thermoleophilaceae bacterium]